MGKKKIDSRIVAGFMFAVPGFAMFCFAILIPFFMGVKIAFTDWNGISKTYKYVGFANFISIFKDQRIILPFTNSLIFALFGVIGGTILSLGTAMLVNYQSGKMSKIGRTIFFIPVCFSEILTAFIWKFIYKDVFFALFGTESPLSNSSTVVLAITVMGIWNTFGINMLIYLAGLKNVPQVLYEAAKVDGASNWTQFVHITLPLITPSFTVCITLTLTSWLRQFSTTLAATGGGPGGSSNTLAIYIYENLFSYNKAGYGQAVSLLFALFCILLGIGVSTFFRKREIEF